MKEGDQEDIDLSHQNVPQDPNYPLRGQMVPQDAYYPLMRQTPAKEETKDVDSRGD